MLTDNYARRDRADAIARIVARCHAIPEASVRALEAALTDEYHEAACIVPPVEPGTPGKVEAVALLAYRLSFLSAESVNSLEDAIAKEYSGSFPFPLFALAALSNAPPVGLPVRRRFVGGPGSRDELHQVAGAILKFPQAAQAAATLRRP